MGVGWSRPHEDDAAEVVRNALLQLPVVVAAAVGDVEVGVTDATEIFFNYDSFFQGKNYCETIL